MSLVIHTASITDKGLNPHKTVNEDSLLILEKERIFVVADGVGGAYAGDVASQTVTRTIEQKAANQPVPDKIKSVQEFIQAANSEVYKISRKEAKQMGSTIALMALEDDAAIIAHVGDSRIYVVRDDAIIQLTKDDSKIQKYRDKFANDPDIVVENIVKSNIITNALGIAATVDYDVQKVMLKDNDIFILCTDGVHNYHSDAEFLSNLTKNQNDLPKACQVIKQTCYEKGARDHLTVILVKINKRNPDLEETQRLDKSRLVTLRNN